MKHPLIDDIYSLMLAVGGELMVVYGDGSGHVETEYGHTMFSFNIFTPRDELFNEAAYLMCYNFGLSLRQSETINA